MFDWNASFDVPLIYACICLFIAASLAYYVVCSIANEYYS